MQHEAVTPSGTRGHDNGGYLIPPLHCLRRANRLGDLLGRDQVAQVKSQVDRNVQQVMKTSSEIVGEVRSKGRGQNSAEENDGLWIAKRQRGTCKQALDQPAQGLK